MALNTRSQGAVESVWGLVSANGIENDGAPCVPYTVPYYAVFFRGQDAINAEVVYCPTA